MDEKGNVLEIKDQKDENPDSSILNEKVDTHTGKKDQKQYTPIGSYKPTGNLVYNPELFEKIEKKVVF